MKRGHIITIGSFDGVHLGHQALIQRAVKEAEKRRISPLALTFSEPPKIFLNPTQKISLLSSAVEKEALLRFYGIKKVMFLKFDAEMCALKPFHFFKNVLLTSLQARGIVIGLDFRFGADRSAGAHELVKWGLDYEIPVWVIPPVKRHGRVVSSSHIRSLLEHHRFQAARGFLGHPYWIAGKVKKGHGLGRQLGFPTANIDVKPNKILPTGVFAVTASVMDQQKKISAKQEIGVCNIGYRPTLNERSRQLSVEVHLFHFKGALTGKTMAVRLCRRLRGEKKFSSLEALSAAIAHDAARAHALLTPPPGGNVSSR